MLALFSHILSYNVIFFDVISCQPFRLFRNSGFLMATATIEILVWPFLSRSIFLLHNKTSLLKLRSCRSFNTFLIMNWETKFVFQESKTGFSTMALVFLLHFPPYPNRSHFLGNGVCRLIILFELALTERTLINRKCNVCFSYFPRQFRDETRNNLNLETTKDLPPF